MKLRAPFKGTKEEGIIRVKKMFADSRQKISENASDVKAQWNDNVLTFAFDAQGQHIEGTLTVEDGAFDLYAKLPLTLRLFEGTIERMIEAEISKLKLA